jgi:hypothetical protein
MYGPRYLPSRNQVVSPTTLPKKAETRINGKNRWFLNARSPANTTMVSPSNIEPTNTAR